VSRRRARVVATNRESSGPPRPPVLEKMAAVPAAGREEGRRPGKEARGTAGQGAGAPCCTSSGECVGREWGEHKKEEGERGEDDAWGHCVSMLGRKVWRMKIKRLLVFLVEL
jgi:hypothetical protein